MSSIIKLYCPSNAYCLLMHNMHCVLRVRTGYLSSITDHPKSLRKQLCVRGFWVDPILLNKKQELIKTTFYLIIFEWMLELRSIVRKSATPYAEMTRSSPQWWSGCSTTTHILLDYSFGALAKAVRLSIASRHSQPMYSGRGGEGVGVNVNN